MEVSEQAITDLKGEAALLYREYRRLKEAGRENPLEEGARERLEGIRQRYTEIEAALNSMDNHSADEIAHLSSLEIAPYRVHKPVTIESDEDGILNWVFSRLNPGIVISSVFAILLVSICALIFTKNLGFFVVPSSSMKPTLIPNDKLLTMRKSTYVRGDVVVLRDPKDEESYLVKRIIGLENDKVRVRLGRVFVNEQPIHEPYIKEDIEYSFGPYTVPRGQVFVLGDNRNESNDGHKWEHGVSVDSVIGQVKYIYAPSERSGSLPDVHASFDPAGL